MGEVTVDPTMERRIALGRKLRLLRVAAGLTQEQLAKASQLDRKTVNRIEVGRHSVRLDNLWAMADALGVKPSELIS